MGIFWASIESQNTVQLEYEVDNRLRINRRRQVGDRESLTCFESGRRILRPVFAQIGGKLVVSDVLRPILAHVRSKYSNTQPRTRNLEPQADKPRPRVVPLSQPQISKLRKTTCPVQCGPFIFSADKIFWTRHFDYSNKKGKIRQKYNQLWYKEARPQPRTVLLQDVPFVTTGRCRSADLAVAGVVAEQGPCKPTPTEATKPKRRSPLFLSLIRQSAHCPLAFRSW